MTLANYPSEIATRIFDLMDYGPNKLALLGPEGSLFYSDQDKLPTTPTCCVEAGPTTRPLMTVTPSGTVENTHECYILLYHGVVQSLETTKLESEQIAERIVKFLDSNTQLLDAFGLDPKVIHGWCVGIDPGYSVKSGTLVRATRITWNGKSKTRLGA
jgi:hypothetical protein